MNLGPLFTLVTFLGATWYFLFQTIRRLTVESPAYELLLPLAFVQSVVVIYLILALVVFYRHGLTAIGRTAPQWTDIAQSILFLTWPFSLLSVLLGLVLAKLEATRAVNGFTIVLAISCLFYGAYEWRCRDSRNSFKEWFRNSISRTVLIVLISSGLFAVPYVFSMSVILADVLIETDKRFYSADDKEVIISIRRGGYVVCPEIESIEIGSFRSKVDRDGTYSIPLHSIRDANYVMVTYHAQLVTISRRQFTDISIVKALKSD